MVSVEEREARESSPDPVVGRDGSALRTVGLAVALGVVGLALGFAQLPVLGRETPALRLGGIPVLVAFLQLGPWAGSLAALIAFGRDGLAGPAGALLVGLDLLMAWSVWWLVGRGRSLAGAVLFFWGTLGALADLATFGLWLGATPGAIALAWSCQLLSGVAVALITAAVLDVVRAGTRGGPAAAPPLAAHVSRGLMWAVVVPTFLATWVAARVVYRAQDAHAEGDQQLQAQLLARALDDRPAGNQLSEALQGLVDGARRGATQRIAIVGEGAELLAETRFARSLWPLRELPRPQEGRGTLVYETIPSRSFPVGPRRIVFVPTTAHPWTIVVDAPLLGANLPVFPLLLAALALLVPALLIPVAAGRLARVFSSALAAVDEAAVNLGKGQAPETALLERLRSSAIAEHRDLASHLGKVFEALAHNDVLTGLPNRKLLHDRLALACVQAAERGENLALLFVDLDRFRAIDGAVGHSSGNDLLRRIASRLRGCVGAGDTVARVGGDEFALLVPRVGRVEDADAIARKVMEVIKRPFLVERREVIVTASVGFSLFPRDGEDAETLLQNAIAATYVAKETGQDSLRRYTARITAREAQRLNVESGLRRALDQGELRVHFQPIVDIETLRFLGAEALVRWEHPTAGLLPASQFVGIAEASGLIATIDAWVLRAACVEARRWADAGHRLVVSVNLSARHLQQADLADEVAHVAREVELEPSLLELEITEGGAIKDVERSVESLKAIRDIGVSVSVDDFGTGYSSLSYLKRLPVDRVKLDQSFVRDLVTSRDDAAIATAVIAMAHSLGLGVVAEGVETEAQLEFLRRHACDAAQGHFFSPPVSAEAFRLLIPGGTPVGSRDSG
jgi:diguanylate cyclase (GGDEF)-like protein